MANEITSLAELTSGNLADGDLIEVVDVSDTSMAVTGTNKRTLWSSIKAQMNTLYVAVSGALGTPSSGDLTNCTGLPTAGLVDDAVTLAKRAAGTAGNLITFDASGNPAAVATGTAGQVLTSNGAGAAPTMQASGGSGVDVMVIATKGGTDQTDTYTANTYITVAFGESPPWRISSQPISLRPWSVRNWSILRMK